MATVSPVSDPTKEQETREQQQNPTGTEAVDSGLAETELTRTALVETDEQVSEAPSAGRAEYQRTIRGKTHADGKDAQFNWIIVGWLVMLHVGALAAPFFFSWQALVITLVLHWLNGSVGICLGFHRLLTHQSFKTYPFVRYTLAFLGGLAGEGCAIDWVSSHRKHHAHSDQEEDPHSPRDGGMWSHCLWLGYATYGRNYAEYTERWAPDLAGDRIMQFLDRFSIVLHFVIGFILAGVGYWLGGAYMATSFVVWGVFLRLVAVLHTTWFVNSASHIWGYTNYKTSDDSKNNWWVALIAYGEGWHNNHHAFPRMARHGHRWWEIDMTFWLIRGLKACGLAWDVVEYSPERRQRAMETGANEEAA